MITRSKSGGTDMSEPGSYHTETGDMRVVHEALLAAFDAADGLVAAAGSDGAKVATVATFFENILEFLHVHHEGEDDLLYPKIVERCTEHSTLLEQIDKEHALLNEPMATARGAIAAWAARPTPDTGAVVATSLDIVEGALRPHLRIEEELVLPIAAAHLSPEEWGELPAHSMQSFSGDKPWLPFGLILDQLSEEQRAVMLSHLPEPVHQAWNLEWSTAFAGFMTQLRSIAPVG
jgi:hemerythrin-like domain-containing protein